MTQVWVMRLVGAALTAGGIALAAFINSEIPEKTLLHLAVIGVGAFVAVVGIGIYEDAAAEAQKTVTAGAAESSKAFAPQHIAH